MSETKLKRSSKGSECDSKIHELFVLMLNTSHNFTIFSNLPPSEINRCLTKRWYDRIAWEFNRELEMYTASQEISLLIIVEMHILSDAQIKFISILIIF